MPCYLSPAVHLLFTGHMAEIEFSCLLWHGKRLMGFHPRESLLEIWFYHVSPVWLDTEVA